MQHISFHRQEELLGEHQTFTGAYESFLQSGSVPPSLEEDIYHLEHSRAAARDDEAEVSCVSGVHHLEVYMHACMLVYTQVPFHDYSFFKCRMSVKNL